MASVGKVSHQQPAGLFSGLRRGLQPYEYSNSIIRWICVVCHWTVRTTALGSRWGRRCGWDVGRQHRVRCGGLLAVGDGRPRGGYNWRRGDCCRGSLIVCLALQPFDGGICLGQLYTKALNFSRFLWQRRLKTQHFELQLAFAERPRSSGWLARGPRSGVRGRILLNDLPECIHTVVASRLSISTTRCSHRGIAGGRRKLVHHHSAACRPTAGCRRSIRLGTGWLVPCPRPGRVRLSGNRVSARCCCCRRRCLITNTIKPAFCQAVPLLTLDGIECYC